MKTLPNIHPGEILKEDFLIPMGISQYRLASDTKMPHSRITAIVQGKRSLTADTAMRLAIYFGNSPEFWLNAQNGYDLEETEKKHLEREVKPMLTHL
jgi:addiction module HigA family antidote